MITNPIRRGGAASLLMDGEATDREVQPDALM